MSRIESPPQLTAHLGYWLRAVSNSVSQAFARRLEAKGVTVSEWVIMRKLHGTDPMAPSQVAEALGMTRGAITKLADRLAGKNLLVRSANPDDARGQTIALTKVGERLVPELAALADENDAAFFSHLTAAERNVLRTILTGLVERHQITVVPVT